MNPEAGTQDERPAGIRFEGKPREALPAQRVNPKPSKKPQSCCGFRIPYF